MVEKNKQVKLRGSITCGGSYYTNTRNEVKEPISMENYNNEIKRNKIKRNKIKDKKPKDNVIKEKVIKEKKVIQFPVYRGVLNDTKKEFQVKSLIELEQLDGTYKTVVEKIESGHITYRLTPDRLMENGKNIEEFLKTITALKKPFVSMEDKRVMIEENTPFYYEILIDKGEVKFYYIIPEKHDKIVTTKLKRTYTTATILKEEDYFSRFVGTKSCDYNATKHFMFSLNTDYRENGFIEGILGLASTIEDTVLLQIGFQPLQDSWHDRWNAAYDKAREGKPPEVNPNMAMFIVDKLSKVGDTAFGLMDILMDVDGDSRSYDRGYDRNYERSRGGRTRDYEYDRPTRYERPSPSRSRSSSIRDSQRVELSQSTIKKVQFDGFNTQIRLFCDNEEKLYYYSKMFEGVMRILDEDQKLVKGSNITVGSGRKIQHKVNKMIFSAKELAVFLQQPNRRMQREFQSCLKSIDSVEIEIPEELQTGGIPIGTAKYKGKEFLINWPTEKSMAAMHKVITGLQRTGKSSYLANFAIEAIMRGESVIVPDTIKDCDLANEIRDHLPEEHANKLIVLNFSDLDYLIPLAWNEITNVDSDLTGREKLQLASLVAGSFEYFLETAGDLKSDNNRFSPRMKRYMSAACKIVFSINGTNISDVIDCLTEHEMREDFIRRSGFSATNRTVQELRTLDDVDKQGNIITKQSEISGIIDRVSLLFNDYMMELMLSTPNNNKIDFKYWADNGYCVILKMSELDFSRSALKTLMTLIYSKIWLSMVARGRNKSHKLTHVILDEVHNFPQVTEMLKLNCREAAKYGLSYVFTSHLLIDLKGLLPYIKGSGSNFMLFKTTLDNFKLLEKELDQGGFTLEDCMQIRDYHTISIVNYDRDYTVFMSKVVDQVEKRFNYTDRSYLDKEHSEKYAVKYVEEI